MVMNFFSLDSKFMQKMTAFGEIMLINICWIIGSLPLLTVGASNIAIYTVMGRRLRGEGSGTVVPFFKAWWSNLKTGIQFWIPQVFVTFSLVLMLFLTVPVFLKVIAVVLLILVSLVFSVMYPQAARFRNRWFAYLRNAVILLILKPGWVLLNLVVLLIPVILFLLAPVDFLRFGFIWIFVGISGVFLVSSDIVQNILQPLEDKAAHR